jgi:thioredoxin-related protein
MLKVNKNAKKELLVFKSPSCYFCQMLHTSGKCEDIKLTKVLILSEYSMNDR